MNILRNVRWGYTGDGMGCGPCGGFDAVELVVEREEGKLTFVRFDCMGQYAAATITGHSTFDDFVFINDMDNLDAHDYDFDLYEYEVDEDDPYYSVLNLGFTVLKYSYENNGRDGDGRAAEYDGARTFVKEWLDKDLDQCNIPLFCWSDEEDWDDEEEDGEEG